jgi:hypothetical protein
LAALLALICLAVAIVGVPVLQLFSHDIFISLDGGWRVLHGQRPSVDFYSQMGPVYYLLHATGLWIAGGDARGLGYGIAIATSLICVWSFFLLHRRMKPGPFFVACIFLAMLAAAPFPIGSPYFAASFSMKHNRYCFALTALILLESFLPQNENMCKRRFLDAFSSGFACAVMLFLKISYGFVGLAIAAVSVPLQARGRTRLAGLMAGFAAFSLPMMAYLRFDLYAQVFQYHLLAGVQSNRLTLASVYRVLHHDCLELGLVVLMIGLVSSLPGVPVRRRVLLILAVAIATSAGVLLMLTNTQRSGMPLLGAAVLLLLNEIQIAHFETGSLPKTATLLCLGFGVIGLPVLVEAAGIAVALEHKLLPDLSIAHFREVPMASIGFAECPFRFNPADNGRNLVRYTEEGISLAQANIRPGESVQGLTLSNPFSFSMGRAPAFGGAVNLSNTNISASSMPPKQLLFGNVDLILVPKFHDSGRKTLDAILRSYPELLVIDYRVVAESENWTLYRRTTQSAQRP